MPIEARADTARVQASRSRHPDGRRRAGRRPIAMLLAGALTVGVPLPSADAAVAPAEVDHVTSAATVSRPAVRLVHGHDAGGAPGEDSAGGSGGGSSDGGGDDGGGADRVRRVVASTGQTACHDNHGTPIPCGGTGQDGDIRAGVERPDPRFTDRGDGTVRDNLTGLIWLQRGKCLTDDGKVGWNEALRLAAELADGHAGCRLSDGSRPGDWRLPNVRELMSLVEVGSSSSGPALPDGHPFTNVMIEMHWTSTTRASGGERAWTGSFFLSGRFSSANKATSEWWAWAVRSDSNTADAPLSLAATNQTECFDEVGNVIGCAGTGQDGEIRAGVPVPAVRFTDNGDGTVTDHLTGLVWMQRADCTDPANFTDALADVAALAAGECGLSDGSVPGDWRIPNYFEMLSLHDVTQFEPQLTDGHPFERIRNELYWTSTTLTRSADRAWKMNSYWINIHGGSKTGTHRSWPVRDAD